ncbi:hypothetical protein [Achromobacter insuavis]|uniref:hypothetical protein n=2 Tax=Bacteria TaxID=2 RepID=UPI001F142D83|nr:hypothetical protein [Achromobacter insuavis]
MSKLILSLLALLSVSAIAGCASSPSPFDQKQAAFTEWRLAVAAREARGELSRIGKLKEMYALLATEPVSISDVAGMRWASSDITTLEAFHAGKIDRLEAESRLRESETAWRSEVAQRELANRPIATQCVTWQGITQCATQ